MKFKISGILLLTLVLSLSMSDSAKADMAQLTLSNGSISPSASSYGTVTILGNNGETGDTTVTIEFAAASGYEFHNAGVGWNVASLDSPDSITNESVTTCTAVGGATCTYKSGGGNFDGFGSFDQSVSGGTGSSSGITDMIITITGTDLDLADFEVSNSGNPDFAAQVSPYPCSSCGTGFAASGPVTVTPEPASILLFGTGLLSMVGLVKNRKRIGRRPL